MFFSLDGVDGAGKTTQLQLFCEWLSQQGHSVETCRDPGGTPLGESIRGLLLDPNAPAICRRSEMLLYMAARAQLVEQVIAPALKDGKTVVSDRFLLANVVYQGHAGGLDVDELWRIGRLATLGYEPDLTLVLDLAPEETVKRLRRPLDRMEQQGGAFASSVRAGFLAEAAKRPDRLVVIDAAGNIDQVQDAIRRAVSRYLQRSHDAQSKEAAR